jgi:hypothetical protein
MGKIFCEIRSGLGNQLFQFAFAYALCREFDRELILCPSYFDAGWKRTMKKILGREVRSFRLHHIIKERFDLAEQNTLNHKVSHEGIIVLKENETEIQDIRAVVKSRKTDVYLKGYWQNPSLFSQIHKPLADLIEPSFHLSDSCRKMLVRIDEAFVGVHVRRGDFLTNRSFGACTVDYYKTAMLRIKDFVSNPRFIVFTNDKRWVNDNFGNQFSYEVYSNPTNKNTDVEELYLMTKFKFFIIANSTFSWWGAYLNATPDKTIFSPSTWFLKSELQKNVDNFNLKEWIVLDNQLELKN